MSFRLSEKVFTKPRIAYKVLRLRRDGSLGPLFINRRQVIPLNTWLIAEDHPTEGFAHRPGWHAAPKPFAPHLTLKGRIWMKVEIADYRKLWRPQFQGGAWLLAKRMRVIGALKNAPRGGAK